MAHTPYEQKLNHKADFRVSYRFYAENEGEEKEHPLRDIAQIFGMNIQLIQM